MEVGVSRVQTAPMASRNNVVIAQSVGRTDHLERRRIWRRRDIDGDRSDDHGISCGRRLGGLQGHNVKRNQLDSNASIPDRPVVDRRPQLRCENGSSLVTSTIAMGMSLVLLLVAVSLALAVDRLGTISATVDRVAVVAAAHLASGAGSARSSAMAALAALPDLPGSHLSISSIGHLVTVTDQVPLSDIFSPFPLERTMQFTAEAYGS